MSATIWPLGHVQAARFMVEAGVPIEKAAQMLGHSNPSVTDSVYARYQPDSLSDAAEILSFGEVKQVRP